MQRKVNSLVNADGSPVQPGQEHAVAIAKAEYYLSGADRKASTFNANSTLPALRGLCDKFSIPWAIGDRKINLVERLMDYYVGPELIRINCQIG